MHNKLMKKKTKRILFYFSVLIFFILSFLVVLFALGYKYDFVQNKFFSTGSLELKANVAAEVYINDELAGSTSFLSNSFSKGRLLPRTYNVRVQNEKYQLWHKLVKVEAGFLVSFPRVVLLPQDFESEVVASSSAGVITIRRFEPEKGLAVLGNKQKLEAINLKSGEVKAIKTPLPTPSPVSRVENGITNIISPDDNKNAWFNEHELWVKWIKDSGYQPYKLAGDTELITRFSQKIEDANWYKDSEHLMANVGGILKFIEIDDRGGINIFDIPAITGPFYYDRNQDAIFKFEGNKLVRIYLSK